MLKIIKFLFWTSILSCISAILIILVSYLTLRPSLPEISLVDEGQLQMPLKVYTEDRVLIGEFGEIKRGYIYAKSKGKLEGKTLKFPSISVGATQHLIMSSVLSDGNTSMDFNIL